MQIENTEEAVTKCENRLDHIERQLRLGQLSKQERQDFSHLWDKVYNGVVMELKCSNLFAKNHFYSPIMANSSSVRPYDSDTFIFVFITTCRNSLEDEELKLQEELKRQSTLLFHTYFLCPDFPKYHFIDFEGN